LTTVIGRNQYSFCFSLSEAVAPFQLNTTEATVLEAEGNQYCWELDLPEGEQEVSVHFLMFANIDKDTLTINIESPIYDLAVPPNTIPANTLSFTYTTDQKSPTVSFTTNPIGTNHGTSFELIATFSEPVTGVSSFNIPSQANTGSSNPIYT
jgi:hypothetical protein